MFVVSQENPLANIKRVDCALLPPCHDTLEMKVKRTQFVTLMWKRAVTPYPGDGLSPIDYGWHLSDNLLKPTWFKGPVFPSCLFQNESSDVDETEVECDTETKMDDGDIEELVNDSDDDMWSEDSENEDNDICI